MGPPGIYSWNCIARWFIAFDGNGSFWLVDGSYGWPISEDCSHDNRLYKRWSWMLALSRESRQLVTEQSSVRLDGEFAGRLCPWGRVLVNIPFACRRRCIFAFAGRLYFDVAVLSYLPVDYISTRWCYRINRSVRISDCTPTQRGSLCRVRVAVLYRGPWTGDMWRPSASGRVKPHGVGSLL